MFKVNVYIENDQRAYDSRPGWYGVVVEYQKTSGELETREKFGSTKATRHQMTLIALNESLKLLRKECLVTVFMGSDYISNMIKQDRPSQWQRNDWKKANKEPVANKNEWQQFLQLSAKHQIEVIHVKEHAYTGWLKEEIKKRKEGDYGKN